MFHKAKQLYLPLPNFAWQPYQCYDNVEFKITKIGRLSWYCLRAKFNKYSLVGLKVLSDGKNDGDI
jgi:hypothetical protein